MSDLNSIEYYRRREQQERALARTCINPHTAAIHLEMADRYVDMIEEAKLEMRLRPLRNALLL